MAVVYILPEICWVVLHTHTPLLPAVMLHRKNSTNVAPVIPPRPTSGSLGGKRPPNIATNQQSFRASTTGTVETESPLSETSPEPQVTPSIPPRPPTFPRLPPGVGGLRRQTIRSSTYDIYAPVPEEPVPSSSQSPSITTMPSPSFPQVPGNPPLTPMGHGQPVPHGGGFSMAHLLHRDPHHNTPGYPYRPQSMASARSDSSGPPQYESAAVTGGIHAKVWPTYNKISREADEKMLEKWNSDLDVLLIFVSLVFGRDR